MTPPPARKKALIIGIKEVRNKAGFGPIHFAHRDARNMEAFLIAAFGYKKEDVVLMLDVAGHKKELLPTKAKMLKQIKLLVKDAAENDQFFFYYSGHGTQVTCCHNSEDDGLDEVLLAANGKGIMDNLLNEHLVKPLLNVKNTKLFALFDCCHSASMLDLQRYSQHSTCSSALRHMMSGVTNGIVNI
ncbi:peptidase C14, caspase domain-containing protein [Phlebopus sp. FC_14]|nr:peptidase C14, caspase domain-containing protein [Phlebopus sp. FC_14]